MLHYLLGPLGKQYLIFNLFNYLSFRTSGAVVTAIFLAFVIGPWIIRRRTAPRPARRRWAAS